MKVRYVLSNEHLRALFVNTSVKMFITDIEIAYIINLKDNFTIYIFQVSPKC